MEKENYINEFLDIYAKLDKVSEKRTDVSLAILAELQKDRRGKEANDSRKQSYGPQSATERQLVYLKDLKVPVEEGITKEKAQELIAKAKEERRK